MSNIELLSPVGNFECLKSAVQNGANAVYFGADKLNARQNGTNFNKEELAEAIEYAKLRGVKTHLTLNILIQNSEFDEALELVDYVYKLGIDAIIVQDLGLVKEIINNFPGLEVHASTQMTTYNLSGVQQLEKLGFNRAVLARELSLEEINEICKNSKIDIEIFIHGALCICYSGQCLMSSIIGGRSGNRGKCAGTCRLPYTLNKDNKRVESGYLLSSKDVCALDILPEIIKSGVKSLKIEGRMKSPEYVGIVTSIYRKYIDLAESGKPYIVEKTDKEMLAQIFNRGGFSTGYLKGKLGKDMMYTRRPNHIGIEIGKVVGYNRNKGYVKVKLSKEINLGDSIAIGDTSCKISELMKKNTNFKTVAIGEIATIGRIYGNISEGVKVYKTVDLTMNKKIIQKSSKENIKRPLDSKIILKNDMPVVLELKDNWSGIKIKCESEAIVSKAESNGITTERIIGQLSKTGNTIFKFEDIKTDMDENIIIPISSINELRRNSLEELENELKSTFKREDVKIKTSKKTEEGILEIKSPKVSLSLNKVSKDIDYTKITGVDNVYIPFRYFINKELEETISLICNKFNTYIMFPNVAKGNYEVLIKNNIQKIINRNIKGAIISNLSQLKYVEKFDLDLIANYTINAINDFTIDELKKFGLKKMIVLPELNKSIIKNLQNEIEKEIIVYGRTLLMTSEYCVIGPFKDCTGLCQNGKYTLKDRLGFEFPVYTDRINCNNYIYNSKITSIKWTDLNVNSIRIDILEEDEQEINRIIEIHKNNERLEGKEYTNGNLNNSGTTF